MPSLRVKCLVLTFPFLAGCLNFQETAWNLKGKKEMSKEVSRFVEKSFLEFRVSSSVNSCGLQQESYTLESKEPSLHPLFICEKISGKVEENRVISKISLEGVCGERDKGIIRHLYEGKVFVCTFADYCKGSQLFLEVDGEVQTSTHGGLGRRFRLTATAEVLSPRFLYILSIQPDAFLPAKDIDLYSLKATARIEKGKEIINLKYSESSNKSNIDAFPKSIYFEYMCRSSPEKKNMVEISAHQ